MHRDFFRHDDPGQDVAGQEFLRCRAAAAVPGKQRVGRDGDDIRIRLAARCPCGAGDAAVGQKRQPGHGLLAVKDLHAVQFDRLPAVQYGLYAVNRVGAHRCVGLVQTVRGVGGGQAGGFGKAVRVGRQVGEHRAVLVQHGQGDTGQRGRLPRRCVNLDTAIGHSKTPPVSRYAAARKRATIGEKEAGA